MSHYSFLILPGGRLVRAPRGKALTVKLVDLPKTDEEMRALGRPSRDGKKI